jgi:toxin ParE1/3/4
MKVTIAEAAETDLERIGDSIAPDLPRRAVSFIAELRESCESLGSMPEAFPSFPAITNRVFAAVCTAII